MLMLMLIEINTEINVLKKRINGQIAEKLGVNLGFDL